MAELKTMMVSFKSSEDCGSTNKSNAMKLQCYLQSSARSYITDEWMRMFGIFCV